MVDVREFGFAPRQVNEWYKEYSDGAMLVTKPRCKVRCPHRRTCFKWQDHWPTTGHDFDNACKRCASTNYPIYMKMRDDMMGMIKM